MLIQMLPKVLLFFRKRFFDSPISSISLLKSTSLNNHNLIYRRYKTNTPDFHSNPSPKLSFTIQYFTKSCGLSIDSAISVSEKVKLNEKNKYQFDSVISFLKNNHFSDAQITKLVELYPFVLCNKLSVNLKPKIKFFAENGISGLLIPKLLIACPSILCRSLDSSLKPSMSFLREYVKDPEKIVVAIHRGPWIFSSKWMNMNRILDYLSESGVPRHKLEELIVLQPRCLYQKLERIEYAVEMLKNMGIKPQEARFLRRLRVILCQSKSNWQEKVKVFESMGWSKDEVITTFARDPQCLACSEKKLRVAMDYFVNIVKVDRETIIGYPKFLTYSIEKRVIPRYTVWKILEEKNLTQGKFVWVLNKSEKTFMEQFVTKHSDAIPSLKKIFLSSRKPAGCPIDKIDIEMDS
ncbi:unnamed protein product [Amaranthus hypochondriacus]